MRSSPVRKTVFSHVKVPVLKSTNRTSIKTSKQRRSPTPSDSETQGSEAEKEEEEEEEEAVSTEEEMKKVPKARKSMPKELKTKKVSKPVVKAKQQVVEDSDVDAEGSIDSDVVILPSKPRKGNTIVEPLFFKSAPDRPTPLDADAVAAYQNEVYLSPQLVGGATSSADCGVLVNPRVKPKGLPLAEAPTRFGGVSNFPFQYIF